MPPKHNEQHSSSKMAPRRPAWRMRRKADPRKFCAKPRGAEMGRNRFRRTIRSRFGRRWCVEDVAVVVGFAFAHDNNDLGRYLRRPRPPGRLRLKPLSVFLLRAVAVWCSRRDGSGQSGAFIPHLCWSRSEEEERAARWLKGLSFRPAAAGFLYPDLLSSAPRHFSSLRPTPACLEIPILENLRLLLLQWDLHKKALTLA
ncbi:hypothetical protein AOLI_G00230600 [Acnodon oligacanthus]